MSVQVHTRVLFTVSRVHCNTRQWRDCSDRVLYYTYSPCCVVTHQGLFHTTSVWIPSCSKDRRTGDMCISNISYGAIQVELSFHESQQVSRSSTFPFEGISDTGRDHHQYLLLNPYVCEYNTHMRRSVLLSTAWTSYIAQGLSIEEHLYLNINLPQIHKEDHHT